MVTTALPKPFAVEDLLDRAVEACQPTQDQHERAVTSYRHVGGWVCDPSGSLAPYAPRYSPQGSFVYGTVVRPFWQHEFDLDALARLTIDPFVVSADEAYALVARRIAEHGDLRERMKRLPRCVRLNYKNDFHHDVTPSCDDPRPGGAILVPAKKEERVDGSAWASWKASDPFGYAHWFARKNARSVEARLFANVDPEPSYVTAAEKTPLRKVSQLVKMRRNRFYKPDEVPSSILLTTMAGECYAGQDFTLEANIEIVSLMSSWADSEGDALTVMNPTIADEDFAHCLNSEQKSRLRGFLRTYVGELVSLRDKHGIHRYSDALKGMFDGSVVDRAVRSLADSIQDSRSNGKLHVGRIAAPLIVVTGKVAAGDIMPRSNPGHNFHGGPIDY